jgi:hypothetical protein
MPKKKKSSKNVCKLCGAKKEVSFEGEGVQYPVFSCPEHGLDKRNEWKIWWEMYSERWKEKRYWNNPADRLSCVIGYFCDKFKEFYGHPYTLDVSNPIPYKSKDFVMGRRILAMFENNTADIRIFIRWVFAKKVRSRKYTVNSFGFFANAAFVNEFKAAKARNQVLKRSTPLPKEFIEWCSKGPCFEVVDNHGLKTWNDLNVLIGMVRTYSGSTGMVGVVVDQAVKRGMILMDSFGQPEFKKLED